MDRIKFITIETDSHSGKESKLLHSCNLNLIPIEIYGKGVKWNGFITKFQILKNILPTLDCDIVCWTDSRDVLYMNNPSSIIEAYQTHYGKGKLVFNGETNCFPVKGLAPLHPNQSKKYKYLNSGCIIGDRELLIQLVDACLELYETESINDDQYLIQRMLIDGKYGVAIDYDCHIFQCIWDEDWGRSNNFDLMYRKDSIYNRLSGTYPLIFHAPGPTTTLSQVWKILNGTYYKKNMNYFW